MSGREQRRRGGKPRASGRRRLPLMLAVVLVVCGAVAAMGGWIASLGPPPTGEPLAYSTLVLDRAGRLLRPYATLEGRWRLGVRIEDIDPRLIEAVIAYEDRRFRSHIGVDPLALARAAVQLLWNGRIVSGGSTLTMQVARLLEPRAERTVWAKLRQMVRAIQIERRLGKDQILALYFNLAPYGGNLEGVRAASLAYFGKEPRRLALDEIALLVAIPQSPEARRPDRFAQNAVRVRDRVLHRMSSAGLAPADEVERARSALAPTARRPMPALAPHAADQAVAAAPERSIRRLTIDAPLQRSLEELARDRARAFGPDISAAIVAVNHATGEVLARVANADYLDENRAGQVDMSGAVRSPGSALKPFIYGLAFEDGIAHPETLIEDRPIRYGAYAPENFDLTFQGAVTVRKALQLSLNVPAVMLLEAVRSSRLTARLAHAGAQLMLPKGEAPGLAMGLGGVGVRLIDLTMLYAALARGGEAVALYEREQEASAPASPRRLLDPVAAWYVGQILLGAPPPDHAAGGRIAFKTGTSYGYRDAWAIGFDGRRTIGVWVGRADGAPVPGLVGRSAAAPILFDAFARAGGIRAPLSRAPKGAIASATAKLPTPLQRFRPAGSRDGGAGIRIMFPPEGARIEMTKNGGRTDPVPLKVAGGVGRLTALVNGMPIPHEGTRAILWTPDGPGFARLTVMDAHGSTDSVVVRVQ